MSLPFVTHRRSPSGERWRHPSRIVPLAFLVAVVVGTAVLSVPAATTSGQRPPLLTALFTATSAVCVTGLTVVDTATYWSGYGHVVIMLLIQVGGFGIMSLGTLLAILVFRRLGLRSRLVVAAEMKAQTLGEVRRLLIRLALIVVTVEAVVATVLAVDFARYGLPAGRAAWYGVFHAVSAFNNAGFSLFENNLVRFVGDPVLNAAIMAAIVIGALGSPVLLELRHELFRPRDWSVHTRLTVVGMALVLSVGFLAMLAFEWRGVLSPLPVSDRLWAAAFHTVQQHTTGFNTVDPGAMDEATTAITIGGMFVGGGSASTAGGIKLSTFMLLAYVMLAEARGVRDVTVAGRRIPGAVQRQAISIALLGVGLVGIGTLVLLGTSGVSFEDALFEVTSALATVGLSRGITADLPTAGQLVLVTLMYIGRVGSVTAASALALRSRPTLYRLPEERPIVG